MAYPLELSIMVVRQIAGRGAGIVGRGRGGEEGWDTAAFDATELYQSDSSNAVGVTHCDLYLYFPAMLMFREGFSYLKIFKYCSSVLLHY
jgi:hypothetical protein